MKSAWADVTEWKRIQETLPIPCIDVLPLRMRQGTVQSIGLILRDTPHQGRRWCLVGGRLLLNESFSDAIRRQLGEALGDAITFKTVQNEQPTYVYTYFSERREEGGFDPRQHAIGLTFCVPIEGTPHPQGEAVDFTWFDASHIPNADQFGFGQDRLVAACLARLNHAGH